MSYGPDTNREPCPDRIVDDAGGAFAMGAIGGSVWHGFRGARNAPAGNRVPHAMDAIRARAPPLGGGFAMWGGLFSTFDCALQAIRHKDDPLNAIASGGITGGVLAARGGMRAAGKSAAIGAVLLAIIEGVGIMGTKLMSDPQFSGGALSREMMADQLQQQQQMALDQAKQNAEQDDTKQGWWSDGGNGGVAPATG